MAADTDNAAMTRTEARIIDLFNRAKAARGDEGEDHEIVEILRALAPMLQNGNGTKTKVAWITGAFAVCGLIGGYLAVEVISQGKALAALQNEIQRCIKVNP